MDDLYYAEYFKFEREHWWFLARRNILASQIARLARDLPGPARILNVGAATGATSEMLGRFGNVVSVEYEGACCAFARRSGWVFVNASVTDLPFSNATFDLVCAFDVIEHVDDDDRAVREMMRVCKPGGFISVTVPAFRFLWSHHDEVNHHKRRYRIGELERLFRSSGRILFASYFNALLFLPIAAARSIAKLLPERWTRRGSGSDFSMVQSRTVNAVCFRILNAEDHWLRRWWPINFGVSALVNWRKDA